jgi:non-canonical (house-cleaning) NTP pyrophosphatase
MELGDADDKVFSRVKAKHGSGTVGLLTDGLIDRSYYYEHALLLAMVPWIRPDVYPDGVE